MTAVAESVGAQGSSYFAENRKARIMETTSQDCGAYRAMAQKSVSWKNA